MKIYRLTPERYALNQEKRARQRRGDIISLGGTIKPSKAFVESFGKARAVVEEYMSGKHARAFTLALPVPQSVNHNTRPNGQGGRILTDEHKTFRQEVAYAVYQAKIERLYGQLSVEIRMNAPRMDTDNIVKPILDALQRAGAIANDRNVFHHQVTRDNTIAAETVVVSVREI